MNKTLKIGKNRGKARIWIEGQALAAMGWKRGDQFVASFGDNVIVYTKVSGAPDQRPRKVAGTETRPIIDTNTDKILETLGDDATHVDLAISEDSITITKGKAPSGGIAATAVALALVATSIAAPYLSQFKRGAQRVLVACEESAAVREEFERLGHDAVSCDVLDTRNPHGWHIKGDVRPYLKGDWDLVVGFPPCTFNVISAAWAFKDPDYERHPEVGYHQRVSPSTLTGAARRAARLESIEFVKEIYGSCDRVGLENPLGFLGKMWMPPTQVIQPYQFGHAETKATCLWLKNLDPLVPTDVLDIEEHGYLVTSGKHEGKWRWPNQAPCGAPKMGPSKARAKLKSVTFRGIAQAMAATWGGRA